MRSALLAYMPTVNARHLEWLDTHEGSNLLLVDQNTAESLLPRLARNPVAVPVDTMLRMLRAQDVVESVRVFDPHFHLKSKGKWVLPDETISHLVAEKYLLPAGCEVVFERIWARWDMQTVFAEQPVISDAVISKSSYNIAVMNALRGLARKSPDWWRQVAAALFDKEGRLVAEACNTHMPNEYVVDLLGDPAADRDAGQKGKSVAMHAELATILECARRGIAIEGGSIKVTTFPCEECAKAIAHAGIAEVFFQDGYSNLIGIEALRSRGVRIVQVVDDLVSV